MTDINTIYVKVAALGRDIKSLVQLSQYREYDDLSGVKIDRDDPEQRFLLDETQKIMEALSGVQCNIECLSGPLRKSASCIKIMQDDMRLRMERS